MTNRQALAGVGVLVTRPEHQAAPLATLIEAQGGTAIRFPTMQIVPVEIEADRLTAQLERADMLIFISANAVYCLHEHSGLGTHWRPAQQVAVVGQRTALALQQIGWTVDIVPEQRFDSEALLACDALQQVSGKRITIIRGVGGRETLAQSLRERGAVVDYAEVYRREVPDADPQALLAQWRAGGIDVISITSNTALQNLLTILGDTIDQQVLATPLAVFSQRQSVLARKAGFSGRIVVATNATNEAMVEAVKQAIVVVD